MKTIKIETTIKKLMESYISEFGISNNTDAVHTDGNRVFIIAPNHFGPGYIRVITADLVWSADLNKNQQVKTPTSKPRV